MKLVDAVYLNRGGSKVLLQELVDQLGADDVVFLLDVRVVLVRYPKCYQVVAPGEFSRFKFYLRFVEKLSCVLCMGNVPPPLKLNCPVVTYFHNRLLLEPSASGSGFKAWFSLHLKWVYIALRAGNTSAFAVQTADLGQLLKSNLSEVNLRVWPFWPKRASSPIVENNTMNFGYVSLPYPHKNHEQLLAAWVLLAEKGVFPTLHLTVSADWPHVLKEINLAISRGAKIVNHGFCNPEIIYTQCRWQIFPSGCESFGLGLIESVEAGCNVLAPNLPYVWQVVAPSLTWEGNSAENIAAAVIQVLSCGCNKSTVVVENKTAALVEFVKGASRQIDFCHECLA